MITCSKVGKHEEEELGRLVGWGATVGGFQYSGKGSSKVRERWTPPFGKVVTGRYFVNSSHLAI